MKHLDWNGLYRESWGAEIVPDAFSHPAKFSRGLIRKIYQHALASGYIAAGDTIVDPFGGVALGALDAMRYGLHWRGVELEPHFVALAQANIDLWNQRYAAAFATWGTAQIRQGDSRLLATVLGDAAAVVSSPPYASSTIRGGVELANVPIGKRWAETGKTVRPDEAGYGASPGQLGAMPAGDAAAAVVSSPPYADSVNGGEGPGARFDAVHHAPDNAQKKSSANGYGSTAGNLGRMAAAVVSSPPFEQSNAAQGGQQRGGGFYLSQPGDLFAISDCNIGNDTGPTFWTAARAIVEQAHAILRPGGVAIWVCGDYVRGGQRVPFGQQWLDLCCAVGFTPVEWIRAWKVEPGPVQLGLLGEDRDTTVERVSFFRRLSNQRNPAAAILNEDVIVVRKVQLAASGGQAGQPAKE